MDGSDWSPSGDAEIRRSRVRSRHHFKYEGLHTMCRSFSVSSACYSTRRPQTPANGISRGCIVLYVYRWRIDIELVLLWYISGIVLEMHWHCVQCIGIAKIARGNCFGIVLTLY